MDGNEYKALKEKYQTAIKIREIVFDGDRQDEAARSLRSSLTLQQLIELESFIRHAQDHGLQLVARELN